jgi:hypothetical protein
VGFSTAGNFLFTVSFYRLHVRCHCQLQKFAVPSVAEPDPGSRHDTIITDVMCMCVCVTVCVCVCIHGSLIVSL